MSLHFDIKLQSLPYHGRYVLIILGRQAVDDLHLFIREELNIGNVPLFKVHNIGTVPISKVHNVRNIPTFEMYKKIITANCICLFAFKKVRNK